MLRLSSTSTDCHPGYYLDRCHPAGRCCCPDRTAAVIDGEESGDCSLLFGWVGRGQSSFGELEDDVGFVESLRIGVVTGIASDDADDHLVLGHIDGDLGGIYLCCSPGKTGWFGAFPNVTMQGAEYPWSPRDSESAPLRPDIWWKNALVGIRHAQDSALFDD